MVHLTSILLDLSLKLFLLQLVAFDRQIIHLLVGFAYLLKLGKVHKYNLAFWRLLHAPWRAKINEKEDFFLKPLSKISIATLVEKGGDKITEILEENGMYCTGCPPSVGENLQDGCNIHGVSNEKMKIMTSEIQKIIKSKGVWYENLFYLFQ